MQFHIDGRFQADIRREDASWVVHEGKPGTLPRLDEHALTDLDKDDIAVFLDELLRESFGQHA